MIMVVRYLVSALGSVLRSTHSFLCFSISRTASAYPTAYWDTALAVILPHATNHSLTH